MIDYEHSSLFKKDNVDKQLVIAYEESTITNERIYAESMEIEESICSEDNLRFGSCESSSFSIRVANVVESLKGKKISVSMVLDSNADDPFLLGKYKVDSDVPTADRNFRDIKAYDALYDVINADVSDWYNSLTFPLTLKAFRDSFFLYFGITQEAATLVNDSMMVEETITPSELSGLTVISAICEINGTFGHINRAGNFSYVFLKVGTENLYPSEDLYPDGTLFPVEGNAEGINGSLYRECSYEDYETQQITKLQIRTEEDDIGKIVGNGDNCYIIEDNFLLYGKTDDELSVVAENVFPVMQKAIYRPFDVKCVGNPCVEVGDVVNVYTSAEVVASYVLHRTLKGIKSLTDEYLSDGDEKYSEEVNSVNKSIIQLRGKTNKLVRTVEETILEIADVERDLSAKITMNAESISSEVTRSTGAENSLSTRITQTAESIASEVTRASTAEGNLSTRITQTADSIISEVSRATEAEGSLSTRITQSAEAIELKVSKGSVSSELSIESGQVKITSNRFVLESTNCSISATGTIKASNVDLTGKITATSGEIGGFTITSTGIYSGKSSFSADTTQGVYIGQSGIALGYSTNRLFKVTNTGNIDITGDIDIGDSTAVSSKIGASTITMNYGKSSNYSVLDYTKLSIVGLSLSSQASELTYHELTIRTGVSTYASLTGDELTIKGSASSGVLSDTSVKVTNSPQYGELTYNGLTIYNSSSSKVALSSTELEFSGSGTVSSANSSGTVTIDARYAVIGKSGGNVGFYGSNGSAKKSITSITSTTAATTSTNATKINEILTALKAYNLIG